MELTTMKYHVNQNVAHIVFSRAEAANAVNPIFCKDLKAVMEAIKDDESVRSVVVTAEGKVFCAGGDLKEFKAAGEELPDVVEAMLEDCLLYTSPSPRDRTRSRMPSSA